MNNLEFCFRTLLARGFSDTDIFVLSSGDYPRRGDRWPGDDSPYTYKQRTVGRCKRSVMQATLDSLRPSPSDLVFLYTTGHGENDGTQSYLSCEDPDPYMAQDLLADLNMLPAYEALVVVMQQCASGGFANALTQTSSASKVFFASSTNADDAAGGPNDITWGKFSMAWLSAYFGTTQEGHCLIYQPAGCNGVVEVAEAYEYAVHPDNSVPTDYPRRRYRGAGSTRITL